MYPGGFRHNEQSRRVVDVLENNGRGLNLTYEVRDGMLNHSKSTSGILDGWGKVDTIEGEVVRISDVVAYVNHDIDDAIRAGVITSRDLPEEVVKVLGTSRSARIDTMVGDIIVFSWAVRSPAALSPPAIKMSAEVILATETLRQFLFERVYNVQAVRKKATSARTVLRRLYRHFILHPDDLPVETPGQLTGIDRRTVDYIAGMTDRFALRLSRNLLRS
jgi:dGTPase